MEPILRRARAGSLLAVRGGSGLTSLRQSLESRALAPCHEMRLVHGRPVDFAGGDRRGDCATAMPGSCSDSVASGGVVGQFQQQGG
jgi:hypothetical protein